MKCILIVDDSPAIRKSLRQLLERHEDWKVCGEAVNGQEGIAKAQQLEPDLVVLDLSMPGMNGLEAALEFKRLLPSLPILMFTSFDTLHLRKLALAAGVTAVVRKSEPQALVEGIESLLKSVA